MDPYIEGFMAKCAQHNINPEKLATFGKQAGIFDTPMNMYNAYNDAGGGFAGAGAAVGAGVKDNVSNAYNATVGGVVDNVKETYNTYNDAGGGFAGAGAVAGNTAKNMYDNTTGRAVKNVKDMYNNAKSVIGTGQDIASSDQATDFMGNFVNSAGLTGAMNSVSDWWNGSGTKAPPAKPAPVAKPAVNKPTPVQPTVAKPTVNKPAVTSVDSLADQDVQNQQAAQIDQASQQSQPKPWTPSQWAGVGQPQQNKPIDLTRPKAPVTAGQASGALNKAKSAVKPVTTGKPAGGLANKGTNTNSKTTGPSSWSLGSTPDLSNATDGFKPTNGLASKVKNRTDLQDASKWVDEWAGPSSSQANTTPDKGLASKTNTNNDIKFTKGTKTTGGMYSQTT